MATENGIKKKVMTNNLLNLKEDIGPEKDAIESWKRIDEKLVELNESISNNNKDSTTSNKPLISVSPPSSSSSLKSKLTEQEKEKIKQNFNRLTRVHKKDFWILDSTKERAIENGVEPESVEEKVMQFALSCHYYRFNCCLHKTEDRIDRHLWAYGRFLARIRCIGCKELQAKKSSSYSCQTLGINNGNWPDVFTEEELDEIRRNGGTVSSTIPSDLNDLFKQVYKLKTPVEVFNLARRVDLNPLKDYLEDSNSQENVKSEDKSMKNLYFQEIYPENKDSQESSNPHTYFRKFNSQQNFKMPRYFFSQPALIIFSNILHVASFTYHSVSLKLSSKEQRSLQMGGNEGSSKAYAAANNNERRLSALEPIACRKMGRRVDTSFKRAVKDHTKQMEDSNFKMPLVLRDMLLKLTYTEELMHSVHTIGYDMTGGEVVLLDTDVPMSISLLYLRSVYSECTVPLMALTGKALMENTLGLVDSTPKLVAFDSGQSHWCLHPSISPSTTPSKRQSQA
ncbi:hypothetical protein BDC45DRAFT_539529 [Circinella umbellata]|nr:hypothetical protein BDC45DRAFT_539529 [Circinella umbellata]